MSSIDPAISSLLASRDAALKTQIGFEVASKQLDAQKQQGEAVNQLLQAAAQLGKAAGKGASFDAVG